MGNNEEISNEIVDYIDKLSEALYNFDSAEMFEAMKYMRHNVFLLDSIDDQKTKMESLCMMGRANVIFENEGTAMEYYVSALEIAQNIGDLFMVAKIYNEIGSAYLHINQFRRASEFLMKSERTLDDPICRMDKEYYELATVVDINLTLVFYNLDNNVNSLFYLERAREFNERLDGKIFSDDIMLLECKINIKEGNTETVMDVLGLVIDNILDAPEKERYDKKLMDLIEILSALNDFDRWEIILQKFESFAEEKDSVFLYLKNSGFWSDYFKARGNDARYKQSCLEQLDFVNSYRRLIELYKSNTMDMTIELHSIDSNFKEKDDFAKKDLLTGVGDSYALERDFKNMVSECEADEAYFAMGVINVDDFKEANNTYGHQNGDLWLKRIAAAIKDSTGNDEEVYRITGDEFVILAPYTDENRIAEFAENVKKAIRDLKIENINSNVDRYITVSQGYAYAVPDTIMDLWGFMRYALDAVSEVKKNGKNGYAVNIAGENDYHLFYERFRHNYEIELKLKEGIFEAKNVADFKKAVENRMMTLPSLFEKNEVLLESYLRPLFRGEKELNDEIAGQIIEEIWRMYVDGRNEINVVVKAAELLEEYFEKNGKFEEHMYALIILVDTYQNVPSHKFEEKYVEYYSKLRNYRQYMDNIVKRSVRKELYDAYLNMAVFIAEKPETTFEMCLEALDEEFKYFFDSNIRDYLHFTDEETRAYIDDFMIRMVGSNVIFYYDVDPKNPHYNHAMEFIGEMYKRHKERTNDEYRINVRLFTSYYKLRYLLGEITAKESFDAHRKFWDYNYRYIKDTEKIDPEYVKERKFQLMMFFVPTMIRLYKFAEENNELINISYVTTIVKEYIDYVKRLKKIDNEAYVSRRLFQSINGIIGYIDDSDEVIELLMGLMSEMCFDSLFEANFMHNGVDRLMNLVFMKKPELLVGVIGTKDEDEVDERISEILYYAGNSTYIYNSGNVFISAVSNIVSRAMTAEEKQILMESVFISSSLFEKDERLKVYLPVMKGYGAAIDDTGIFGDYNYKEHENAIIVDLMLIVKGVTMYYEIVDGNDHDAFKDIFVKLKETGNYNNEILDLIIEERNLDEYFSPKGMRDRLADSLFSLING
ncbi:MAG: GGDEF domain-containing protein [Eubacterium sp.]|nr:GGDEF domain-containing protein [Eubacterium sp.]